MLPIFENENKQLGGEVFKIRYFSKPNTFDYIISKHVFPQPSGKNYSKNPILLFGCSYGEGFEINDYNRRFQYLLEEKTQRNVYNKSFGGGGFQHLYYFLSNDKFLNNVDNPEYIIYIFINDHISRFYMYQFWNIFNTDENLRYKMKNGKISRLKPMFFPLWTLFTVKEFQKNIVDFYLEKTDEKSLFTSFADFMGEVKTLSEQKYPNAKFVILLYNNNLKMADKDFINNSDWSLLEQKGFIVVDTKKLVGHNFEDRKYKTADNYHPSEYAWAEITPELIKYLGL